MATTKAHNNGHHEKNVSLFVSHLARGGGRRGNRHTLGRDVKYVHVPSARHHMEYGAYLAVLASAVYTLCPAGDRVDTFRTAEAVGLGVVPVMENTTSSRLLASRVHRGTGVNTCVEFVDTWDKDPLYSRFGGPGGAGARPNWKGEGQEDGRRVTQAAMCANGARGLVLQSHWAGRVRREAAADGHTAVRFWEGNAHLGGG